MTSDAVISDVEIQKPTGSSAPGDCLSKIESRHVSAVLITHVLLFNSQSCASGRLFHVQMALQG